MALESTPSCHGGRSPVIAGNLPLLVIAGTPNVGKSVIFNSLTGSYVAVSNYPGTTVELTKGRGMFEGKEYEVVDTPGMYSLLPITEEERVARSLLLNERVALVLHVVDAKNIDRMLPMTLQLIEAGFPVILDLNIMDEAEKLGLNIDVEELQDKLGIPVSGTVSVTGRGMEGLRRSISNYRQPSTPQFRYDEPIEDACAEIVSHLKGEYTLSKRAVALLLIQGDSEVEGMVKEREGPGVFRLIKKTVAGLKAHYQDPLNYVVALERKRIADSILSGVVTQRERKAVSLSERLSDLTMRPLTGIPILLLVLYFGLYYVVGVFGAGTLVDYIEGEIFEAYINPVVDRLVTSYIPWPWLQSLIGLDYGLITLGFRYALAIILPIVGTFFFVFSIIEDSGYLPRLALLVDRLFKKIGLNGRAVIPMTLGFGCDTMATIVSRTLETRRERVISTLLLALAIPCSAQLGVVLGLLSQDPQALLLWASFVGLVFLFIGYLSAQVLPGERPSFYMEVPPLRLPRLKNVVSKTYARMYWYLAEVLPLFLLASVLIWLGNLTGLFEAVIGALEPVVRFIGLPPESARVFLFGFFRRDYGAAGLYDLQKLGVLSTQQLIVAAATLTLFVPCIAQFTVMIKERGVKTALAITGFIFPFAFLCGYLIYRILSLF